MQASVNYGSVGYLVKFILQKNTCFVETLNYDSYSKFIIYQHRDARVGLPISTCIRYFILSRPCVNKIQYAFSTKPSEFVSLSRSVESIFYVLPFCSTVALTLHTGLPHKSCQFVLLGPTV